ARFRLTLPKHEERSSGEYFIEWIRFARDGRSVAAISREEVHVFSTPRGATLLRLDHGYRTEIYSEAGDLSPDGRWLAHADNLRRAVAVRDLTNPHAATE